MIQAPGLKSFLHLPGDAKMVILSDASVLVLGSSRSFLLARVQCYKTFYDRNLRMFVIS
jgi:hypothetical protein